jgi:radical SAM/Cys-rich protein
MQDAGVSPFRRSAAKILQMNIGLYCNQACSHCHVESSPKRTEMMNHETAMRCIELLSKSSTVETVDITGGAPELNREFRYLVQEASEHGVEVIDRCNLTVLVEPGQEDLVHFLAKHKARCSTLSLSESIAFDMLVRFWTPQKRIWSMDIDWRAGPSHCIHAVL